MNLSVMVGSLRHNSYHRALFKAYQVLTEGMFTFKEIPTIDFPLYNVDLELEQHAMVEAHAETIRRSSGIIFFSPEYNYSIPGHLKNAIDWLSRLSAQPFNGKKAAIIGGSPGAIGTARMQYELRKVGVFLNLSFLNKPEIMISSMHEKFNEDMELTHEQTIDFLKNHAQSFAQFIQAAQ